MAIKALSDALTRGVATPLRLALDGLLFRLGLGPCPSDETVVHKLAFTVAVVALSAKIAKADGVVSQIEREAFQEIFKTSPDEAENVARIFDLAQQDVAGFESYAQQMADLLVSEPEFKRDVFEGLFNIAAADGILHRAEEHYLQQVAEIFGYPPETYRSVRAQFVHDPDDAYTVLGLSPSASSDDIKARYRQLVRETHPDMMVARGVPEEFIDMATRKLAAINAAYERIERERGL